MAARPSDLALLVNRDTAWHRALLKRAESWEFHEFGGGIADFACLTMKGSLEVRQSKCRLRKQRRGDLTHAPLQSCCRRVQSKNVGVLYPHQDSFSREGRRTAVQRFQGSPLKSDLDRLFMTSKQLSASLADIPELPPSRFFNSQDPDFVAERRKLLQTFLDEVLSRPDAALATSLHVFLGIEGSYTHVVLTAEGHLDDVRQQGEDLSKRHSMKNRDAPFDVSLK